MYAYNIVRLPKNAASNLQPDIFDPAQLKNLLSEGNTFLRIILMRHAESLWNAQRRFQGQIDVSLGRIGRRQAQQAAIFLQDVPIERAFCSSLSRASETAQIITRYHPDISVTKLDGLWEIHQGEWQGKQEHEINPHQLKLWQEQPVLVHKAGAETVQELSTRTVPAWQKILLCSTKNTLIVAHEWTNRAILCHALQVPLEHCVIFPQSNCGVTVLDYPNGIQKPVVLRALNITV